MIQGKLNQCKCGHQPKRGLSEKGLYRVVCVKMDGGCAATTELFKDQWRADTAWNVGNVIRK